VGIREERLEIVNKERLSLHVAEANVKLPDFPSMFVRLTNTIATHGSPMIQPKASSDFDSRASSPL